VRHNLYTATHSNTLQHITTHRNTLQHTVSHCNSLQHTASYCNTLQHTATHCNTLQHTVLEWCLGGYVVYTEDIFVFAQKISTNSGEKPCIPVVVCAMCCSALEGLSSGYGVATISNLLKIIGLFYKRALQKRHIFCKETYNLKEPTNRSHPICRTHRRYLSIRTKGSNQSWKRALYIYRSVL